MTGAGGAGGPGPGSGSVGERYDAKGENRGLRPGCSFGEPQAVRIFSEEAEFHSRSSFSKVQAVK